MAYQPTTTDELTPAQAGRLLGVTPRRIVQMCQSGQLPHRKTPLGRLVLLAGVLDQAKARGILVDEVRA